MITLLLVAHVAIATVSSLFVGYYVFRIVQSTHTRRLRHLVVAGSLLTVFSGTGLMFGGGSITRTCITFGVYCVITGAALRYGNTKKSSLSVT